MANNAIKKQDFERFLAANDLTIKVVPRDGRNTLEVFLKERLVASMNEFDGELDLDWAYEYIMDIPGSSYWDDGKKAYVKIPPFRSNESELINRFDEAVSKEGLYGSI